MKRIITFCLFLMLSGLFFSAFAKDEEKQEDTISVLEEKKDLLELHVKVTKLRIKLLKEKAERVEQERKAKDLGKLVDEATKNYEAAESKETRKTLAKAEKMNKKLSKTIKTIRDLEEDIKNTERKIALERYVVVVTEKK